MEPTGKQVVEWTICYHQPGKIKGRGEFLRLILEDAGVPYEDSADVTLQTLHFIRNGILLSLRLECVYEVHVARERLYWLSVDTC
jgi:hypothetical protein